MNRPVEIPCAHATAAATRAAVVLPFVPVAWIVGYVSSGWSSNSTIARIRSRDGPGMCSGWRASRRASASSNRISRA